MKPSLFTTLLALTTMTLMVMTVGSSGLRGLQSVNVENFAASVPSIKISGVSALLKILNSASDFNNAAFDVITLDSFSQSMTDQGIVYEGKVTLANDQGVNVTGLINGVWDPVNNKIALTASKYEADTEDTEGSDTEQDSDADDNSDNGNNSDNNGDGNDYLTAHGFTILDMEVAKNDPSIVAAFEFSVQTLIEKGERQNKIPISNYAVTEWKYASYKNKKNGVYYKFVAKLLGDNYVHVDTNMTTFRYKNQTLFLAGYHFHAYNISKGSLPNNFTDIDNNNANTTTDNNSTEVDNSTIPDNSTIIVDNPNDNSTVPVDNSTTVVIPPVNETQPTNSTINTTTPVNQITADGYTILSADQLAQDSIAQAALQYGANALIQKGISQNKIPAANPSYTINNMAIAAYKKGVIGTSYKFTVNMINADYVHVDTNLTVFYRYSTKAYSLNGYSFRSYNYSSSAIVNPQKNTTNATNNNPVPDNSTQPVDNSTIPDNSTQPVDNNSTTNVTEPANNTTPQVTPDGYTILTADQLAQDSIAQAALQYGANDLIQKGISQNKIPAANSNYTITNVILAAAKKQVIGTSYKFVVNMINADYVHVDTNLTVFYRYSTQAYSLNGYAFNSYNYSSKAKGNKNSSSVILPANNTTSSSNSTVVDQNNNNDNATVVDSPTVVPVENPTVIDPLAPVAGDNSTVVDNSSPAVNNAN